MAWITGPEAASNSDFRTQVTGFYEKTFGAEDRWKFVAGGNLAWEENAVGPGVNAEWYGCSAYLFYKINENWRFGSRGEWFRDDDGTRTGFATNFWEATVGVTWSPYQHFRVRSELRCDWASGGMPFNDGTDNVQVTSAVDMIWSF